MRRLRNDGLAILLGAISALALPPLHLVFVLLLTVPMLLRLVGGARTWKVALRYGFVFGMGLHTAGLYWLTDAVLVRADEFWWLVPLAAPLGAVPLACFTALPCACARLVPEGWRRVMLFAAVWTLSDLARQFVLTGFPWNLWGSIWEFPGLAGDVLIQPAAWVSIHGLTLLTLLLAGSPLLKRKGMLAGAAALTVWIAAGSARLIWPPAAGAPGPWVVLVQGNVPETDKQNQDAALGIYRRYLALTQSGVADAAVLQKQAEARGAPARPIVFAWPESAFPGLLDRDRTAREVLMQAVPDAAVGLVGSVRYDTNQRPRNSMIAVMPDAKVEAVYDKAHLVPFGEYQPPFLPVQIVPGGGFASGPGVRSLHLPGLAPIGPLICYEVIFPGQVVQPNDRPAWLLNITNDAWYGNTAGPRQHLAAARMRAVEEGLPLARAANTGISGAFDGQGRPLARLGWNIAGSVVVALPGPLPPTLFARIGLPIPLLLCLLGMLAAFAPSVRQRFGITISK